MNKRFILAIVSFLLILSTAVQGQHSEEAENSRQLSKVDEYQQMQNQLKVLKTRNSQHLSLIYLMTAAGCVIISVSVTNAIKHRRKLLRHAATLSQLYHWYKQSEESIRSNHHEIIHLEEQLDKMRSENKFLSAIIELHQENPNTANNLIKNGQTDELIKKRLFETDIYSAIQDNLKANKCLSTDQWNQLDIAILHEIPSFKNILKSYATISQQEYHTCMLIKIGISPSEMAILLSCTASAVSKIRLRLQRKMFGEFGASKEFDEFIKSIL